MIWLNRIKNAVAAERFIPYFQPIVETHTGLVVKYEALVRMMDENGTVYSPGQFMTVAKNSKYYQDITRQAFRKAVEAFRDRSEGVAVNLSVLDIQSDSTRAFIDDTLQAYPDVAERLTIEIIEEEGVEHYDQIKEFIRSVRTYGVTIAIDDFGSGYSNFTRIIDLDVDFLKIDGSLIKNICTDPVIRNLLYVIKSFASFSNIPVVAEFVEDESILNVLKEAGIEYAQGYHLGAPKGLEPLKV
jgi:c-di-GMP phosphodiesterase